MNNDFEKNPDNAGEINDTASEAVNISSAISDNTSSEAANNDNGIAPSKSEYEALAEASEQKEAVGITNDFPVSSDTNEQSVTAAVDDTEQASTAAPYISPIDRMYGGGTSSEHTPSSPSSDKSGDFSYTKSGSGNGNAVGYVWDGSAYTSKAPKAKKGGVGGFKVFVAAMLTVFTLSAVTIAVFLAADYMNAPAATDTKTSDSTPSYSVPVQSPQSYQHVVTFTEDESGLTKAQVAAKCQPSAVGIVVEQEQSYSGYSFPFDFGFGYSFGNPGGTQIVQGSGSGFIYSADGYIITNHHVVENASKITVYLHDGTTAEAELVGSDSLSDIAVIKIDATDKALIPMEIGDSSLMNVGDEVIAIGCPAGIEFMGTVTDGIISAINRDVELDNESSMSSSTKTMTLLQTNATINRGNSGGPLINTRGQVIGINTLKLSSDYEGIGFSIPMNGALPIIGQLIEHGKVVERSDSFVSSEGVIGISASEITEQESNYYDIPQGLLVVQIDKDSSASAAGLRRGDIITKFNGTEVHTVNELNKLKYSYKAGDEVTVTVYRDSTGSGETLDITFKLDMAD